MLLCYILSFAFAKTNVYNIHKLLLIKKNSIIIKTCEKICFLSKTTPHKTKIKLLLLNLLFITYLNYFYFVQIICAITFL